jgi:hypothetical protein
MTAHAVPLILALQRATALVDVIGGARNHHA